MQLHPKAPSLGEASTPPTHKTPTHERGGEQLEGTGVEEYFFWETTSAQFDFNWGMEQEIFGRSAGSHASVSANAEEWFWESSDLTYSEIVGM